MPLIGLIKPELGPPMPISIYKIKENNSVMAAKSNTKERPTKCS